MPYVSELHQVSGLATAIELTTITPGPDVESYDLRIEDDAEFVIATIAMPSDQAVGPGRVPELELFSANSVWRSSGDPVDREDVYIAPGGQVVVVIKPEGREWKLRFDSPIVQARINFVAFHPNPRFRRQPKKGLFARYVPMSCRTCKIMAKALAFALSALAIGAAIPAAIIAAVAKFLGVFLLAATQFIQSILGDTMESIAEALCREAGYCPTVARV